jgi:preprotein translocase subunit SecA
LEDDLMRLFGSERIAKVMDRLGMKEGENIEHSMITKNIENAQRKVEQNNFGVRKRLLEYDDVMNSQREVIYSKRRNALYGDKLELDLSNMLHDLCYELVETYQDLKNFQEFKIEVLRLLAYEPQLTEDEFSGKTEVVVEAFMHELSEHYKNKVSHMSAQAYPVFNDINSNNNVQDHEMIVVPITDGLRNIQLPINIKNAVANQGKEVAKIFEKFATLWIIDDEWKEHLREMDELKQSSQNAVFEQKDPLLIYKLESFNLFKGLLSRINREVLGMLFKGHIMVNNNNNISTTSQMPRKEPAPKLQTSRTDDLSEAQQRAIEAGQSVSDKPKQQQVFVDNKIGRNDLCPCGSGKKFKQCHGKEAV